MDNASKDESGGATTVRQEWYNAAEDLIKAAVERTDGLWTRAD
jgi:hypothetical protein